MKNGKVTKDVRLRSLDGVRDISFGSAEWEARMQRDLSKNGKAAAAARSGVFDDDKARDARYQKMFVL
jgi:hypothetical protein